MAFTTEWTCENCGHVILSNIEPDESECICYVEPIEETSSIPPLTTVERSDRYKEQYRLNGFTWNGKPGEMFYQKLNNYPDRSYLKKD